MSIHWPIVRTCIARAKRPILIDDRRQYRGVELLGGALHIARVIEERSGAKAIGILLPASGATAMSALGAWIAGRAAAPLNFLLAHEELDYVIDHSETDLLLTSRQLLDFIGYRPKGVRVVELESMDFSGVPPLRWPALASDDDLGVLLYTSGTSGRPKGVMLTHGNIASNIRQCLDSVHFTPDDIMLGVLPQFHSFGMTVLTALPMTIGCRAVYSPRFVPQQIVKLFRKHHPTVFIGIPSMYNALLTVKDAGPEDFASVRLAISGGEPLPDDVARRFRERFGITISEGYGLTETSPVTNLCVPEDYRPHTVGRPLPRIDQRILDVETRRPLPPNEDGEIVMRGPNLMQGYFKQPEETREVIGTDGFFRTGDIGHFDREGRLYITGRLKEMIIVGGENVFPREVEEVLAKHPSVSACGVTGRRDGNRGEVIVAFVELAEGHALDETELRSWCRERIAGYKVPRHIWAVEELPRNATGKVLRRRLLELAPDTESAPNGESAPGPVGA